MTAHMSQRNAKANPWVIMHEYTTNGCRGPDELGQSTSSESLEDVGSTPQNQVLETDLVVDQKSKLDNGSEASMTSQVTPKPGICRCTCTCNLGLGLANDEMSMVLKKDISASWKHYEFQSSPDSQVLTPEAAFPGSNAPLSFNGPEAWNLPRTLPCNLPLDLQDDLYQIYQSEEDTMSEDDTAEYTMSPPDAAGTIAPGHVGTALDAPDIESSPGEQHPQIGTEFDSNEDRTLP